MVNFTTFSPIPSCILFRSSVILLAKSPVAVTSYHDKSYRITSEISIEHITSSSNQNMSFWKEHEKSYISSRHIIMPKHVTCDITHHTMTSPLTMHHVAYKNIIPTRAKSKNVRTTYKDQYFYSYLSKFWLPNGMIWFETCLRTASKNFVLILNTCFLIAS